MSETDFPSADDPQFDQYMEALAKAINYGQHQELLRGYCAGLIGPGERKSMEPIAARLAPENASAMHQRVHHFVADGAWSDEAVLAAVREQVLAAMLRHGPIRFWIVDDTGIRKKGKESVGVARQYCGEVGKIDNCQVLVSLSVANDVACLPVAARLYLPEAWAEDETRRAKVGVPLDVTFQTKPEIALDQIRRMHTAGVAPGIVLADEAYGRSAAFRQGIAALDMTYAVAVPSSLLVGPPAYKRLPRFWQSAAGTASLRTLAGLLPQTAFRTVTWREGSRSNLTSRFALLRVRVAPSGDAEDGAEDEQNGAEDEQSLLIEWPDDEKDPSGYWLVTLPARVSIEKIVEIAKARWWIEQGYRDLKQEVALADFEGRGWRGFHHLVSLSIAAYGYLLIQRCQALRPVGGRAGRLSFPHSPIPGKPPLRPERHVPWSIATQRRKVTVALVRTLPRCPCCLVNFHRAEIANRKIETAHHIDLVTQ